MTKQQWTIACQAPSVHGISEARILESFPSPTGLSGSGVELSSLALAGGFFTTEPPGKHS